MLLVILTGCNLNDLFGSSTPDQSVPGNPGNGQTRGQLIQGEVRDSNGQPVAGVLVVPQGEAPVPEIAIYTDTEGKYSWDLLPGTYTMTFSGTGYSTVSQRVTVPSDRALKLDITLNKQP
ncbi:MAG: hypothetical protein OHK0022_42220 [Roseiflexaceae bacterium]